MGNSKRKKAFIRTGRLLLGYGLGSIAWAAGLHCLRVDPGGDPVLQRPLFLKHLLKLLLWTLEIGLLYRLLVLYWGWISQAAGTMIAVSVMITAVFFLYIWVFGKKFLPRLLPGSHVFFCPQCYREQTFRFLPVSFQYGFFVTYLCRYCSCLVNGWGEQVFYPLGVPFKKILPCSIRILPVILAVLTAGICILRMIESLLA